MDQLDLDEDVAEALLKRCEEDVSASFDFVQDKYEEFEKLVCEVESKRDEDSESKDSESKDSESKEDVVLSQSEFKKLKSLHGKVSRTTSRFKRDGRFGMLDHDTIGQVVLENDCNREKILKRLFELTNPPSRKRGKKESKIWQWHAGKPGDLSAVDKQTGEYLWKNYDQKSIDLIMSSYLEYKTIGKNKKPVRIKANGKTYCVDFKKMNQVSPNHKYERKIRRVSPSAVRLERWMYESNEAQTKLAQQFQEWKRDTEMKIKQFGMKSTVKLLKKRSSEKNTTDGDDIPPPTPPLLKSRSTKSRGEMRQRHIEDELKRSNFLICVAHEIANIVKRYTTHCILCGDALTYPGAKPTVCHDKLCHYEFNALGLGLDIGKSIVKQQDLFELLCLYFYMCCQPAGKTIWYVDAGAREHRSLSHIRTTL
jgi:hypothetical protein